MICSTNQLTGFYMMAILAFNELNEYIKFTFPKETKETILKYFKSFSPYNLGQKVVDKFTKLSKIGVSVEYLQQIFCDILLKNVTFCLLRGRPGTCHQIQTFTGYS